MTYKPKRFTETLSPYFVFPVPEKYNVSIINLFHSHEKADFMYSFALAVFFQNHEFYLILMGYCVKMILEIQRKFVLTKYVFAMVTTIIRQVLIFVNFFAKSGDYISNLKNASTFDSIWA